MDSLLATSSSSSGAVKLYSASYSTAQYSADVMVLEASFSQNSSAAVVGIDFSDLYKSLSVNAQRIVDKLNEMLKASLPNGLQSLSPDEVTPEATAERIVSGATGLFAAYAEQHPELDGKELIESFMEKIRAGVKQGYEEAFGILQALGAFEFDGVQSGIEETMKLVERKLADFEALKLKELGVDDGASPVSENVKSEVLKKGGVSVLE